jgi:hypothetical protein
MEPELGYSPASSAGQPHEITAVSFFENEVADDGPGVLESAQEPPDSSADWRSSTASPPSRDQADNAAAPSFRLSSQKPLRVGNSLSYALAVEIECCVG